MIKNFYKKYLNSKSQCLFLSLLGVLFSSPLYGQIKTAAIAKMQILNTKAMQEYDGLEFEAAKKMLLEAVDVAKDASVLRHEILRDTYLNLGIVYGAGFNDRIRAIKYFTSALLIDRKVKLNPSRATPALEEMFENAFESLPSESQLAEKAFKHEPLDSVVEGQRLVIRATVDPSLEVDQVVLFYRRSSEPVFEKVILRGYGSGIFQTVIPGKETYGKSIHYYLELQDANGARLAGKGTVQSPLIITIERSDGIKTKSQLSSHKEIKEAGGPIVSIGILVGSGGGVVFGGTSEHAHEHEPLSFKQVQITDGWAWTPFHLVGDLSFHIDEDWQIGGFARIQVANGLYGNNIVNRVSLLGQARAKYFFKGETARFFITFGAGGGQIRHRVALGAYHPSAPSNTVVDARVSGVAAAGFGTGLWVEIVKHLSFVAELYAMGLGPDWAAHVDLNMGLFTTF